MQIVNLRKSREELNLTQIEIAKLMNVDNSTFSGWETGKDTIPLEQLIKYANLFKYNLNYLFGLNEKNNYQKSYKINLTNIGKKIRKQRLSNNLTLEDVAKKLNTSKSTFWAYENGKYLINTSFLFGLTNIFKNFSIDAIFDNK